MLNNQKEPGTCQALLQSEVVYHGDVLNAARIQARCNELNSYLLISDTLFRQLRPLSDFMLRGKVQLVGLYDVTLA